MNIQRGKYGPLVGAVDQGTSSTRFLVFASKTAELITYHQMEINQIYPKEGWVEEDPLEILRSVTECMEKTVNKLHSLEIDHRDIKAIGVSNQRETTIVWDKTTGEPLHNAIVWLDSRTSDTVEKLIKKVPGQNKEYLKGKCGLPISTYFSALKLHWLIEHEPRVTEAIKKGNCMFGTVDSWLIWNLTGGKSGGVHVTDVTNASRTMLMDLESLQWDPYLCNFFQIPRTILPTIKSSSEIYGYMCDGSLKGVPISGCLGDQSSALVGQLCFRMGQCKNTYGTGCFLLYNTGTLPVWSKHGLLTTVAYKLGPKSPTYYALEGSVAIAGASIRWLRDNLGILSESAAVESLASSVESEHGLYFVPAFSGLYAPYWDTSARGLICGITQFTTKAHIARAALMAVCFQTKEIIDAMNLDCGVPLTDLQVDGGMTVNNLLMQLQADVLGIPVVRPSMPETTALGAAMAAGAAEGVQVWSLHPKDLTAITTDTFNPAILSSSYIERERRYRKWKDAVRRCRGWATAEDSKVLPADLNEEYHMLKTLPGGIFVFTSFALLAIAKHLAKSSVQS